MPQHSAVLPAYGSKSIHANHIDMTKFESTEDSGFVDVSTTLWRWARDLSKEATATRDAQPAVAQHLSELPYSLPRPLTIEDGRSQGKNVSRSFNTSVGRIIRVVAGSFRGL